MRRNIKKKHYDPNALSIGSELLVHLTIGAFSLICIIPFLFVVIISLTPEADLVKNGYSFLPNELSLDAYRYIMKNGDLFANSFFVSIMVTVIGTIISVTMTAMYAYALFRKDFKWRSIFTFYAFFTMLFGGGLVPFYITMTQMLHLRDSFWALIVPMLLSPFNIIILRTFFSQTIPSSLMDSARIDGSGEFNTFIRIVIPISLPGLATIGLFNALGYWNDWFNALLFIDKASLTPLQFLLMRIQNKMDFLVQNSRKLTGTQASTALATLPRESARMVLVVLIVMPIAFAYPFFQRYFVQGLTIGAVKG